MKAFARFAQVRGLMDRRPLVVSTDGMWGGLVHVRRAFGFVRGTLLSSRGTAAALAALKTHQDPARLIVAMHVRRGDFGSPPSLQDLASWRGRFNTALPLSWFEHVAQALRTALGDSMQVQLFTSPRSVPDGSMAPGD
jgi:hypothetical protein